MDTGKPIRTHYDNLKVARNAPDFVIRAAYKSLCQKYHPDKNPGDERAAKVMTIINEAYDVLSDPVKRKRHDTWISDTERQARHASGHTADQPSEPPPRQDQASDTRNNYQAHEDVTAEQTEPMSSKLWDDRAQDRFIWVAFGVFLIVLMLIA